MGVLLLTAFRCEKEKEPVEVNNSARHSQCLNHTDKEAKGLYSTDSASAVYDAANQRLHVTHHNLAVNCGTTEMEGGIIVSATRSGQTIEIYEREDEDNPQADCMCEVDNEFDLYGIEPGTYRLFFYSCYPDPLVVTFSF